jgi:hypothetical protein
MKNLRDQFSDEEKQHLNYLGSMMGRPNTPEEHEIENIWAAMEKGRKRTRNRTCRIKTRRSETKGPNNTEDSKVWGQRLLRKTSFEIGP